MTDRCHILDWDTEFFGVRIARLQGGELTAAEATDVAEWCSANDVACLYFLAAPDDDETVAAAESMGAHLVDVRLTFATAPRAFQGAVPEGLNARSGTPDDLDALLPITTSSYADTRFAVDPRFSDEACAKLYRAWLENSFDGFADEVRVVTVDDEPAGFVTCRLDGSAGEIGLVGVAEAHRGRGAGQLAVVDALSWFADHGAARVTVATQARNLAAQRLYQAAGFRTDTVGLWYHRWAP